MQSRLLFIADDTAARSFLDFSIAAFEKRRNEVVHCGVSSSTMLEVDWSPV